MHGASRCATTRPRADRCGRQGISGADQLARPGDGRARRRRSADPTLRAPRPCEAAEITWSEAGRRLVVRSLAGAAAAAGAAGGHGDRTGGLPAGRADRRRRRHGHRPGGLGRGRGPAPARSPSAAVDGDADVTTGIRRHRRSARSAGRTRVRPGRAGHGWPRPAARTEIKAGSGDVAARRGARATCGVRTGSGDVAHRRRRGRDAGPDHRLGRAAGRRARRRAAPSWTSAPAPAGRAASSTWATGAPPEPPRCSVRGRTGSGDVLVTRAAAPPDRAASPRVAAAAVATGADRHRSGTAATRGAARSPRSATTTPQAQPARP